ncbi:MAG TPA: TonB-dependent receptor, partial [Acidobacteriota bacterium]|nr:TonB-dependent receptor [Acidobacteriota bacterium]
SGRIFDTDGYYVVAEPQRGAVDVPAYVDFQSFFGRVYYRDFHVGLNIFHEDRGNGTPIQTNNSRIYMFETGLQRPRWNLNFYTQSDLFESRFSRIVPDRSQEFLTADQRFPSVGTGAAFSYLVGGDLRVGADWRYASWDENRQNLAGVFVQDLFELHPRLDLLLGTRLDTWENRETQTSFNPRAGLVLRASDELTLRSSLYRGFRAPTLNELYRPFRVGNIVTEANPDLGAESLWGLEAGFDLHPQSRVLFRVNGFWNRLADPVSNVTISSTPELIQRQRQNLGRVDIRGLELDSTIRLRDRWSVQGAYLASFTEVDSTGLRLPQVPLHQAAASLRYDGPWSLTAQARYIGRQYEDDENELPLGGFFTLDLWLRRVLTERLDLFLAIENLLDRQYAVGRTPEERLGQPRLLHGGISFRIWQ